MDISVRLRELRSESGLTQKELAQRLKITQDSISLWEKGKRVPDTHYILAMADIFDVSTDYILGRSDDLGNVSKQGEMPIYTKEEKRLIENYRGLSKQVKDLIWNLINVGKNTL